MSLDVNLFQLLSQSYLYLTTPSGVLKDFLSLLILQNTFSYQSSIGHLHLASECQSGPTFRLCRVCQDRLVPRFHLFCSDWLVFLGSASCGFKSRSCGTCRSFRSCRPFYSRPEAYPHYSPQLPCLLHPEHAWRYAQ